MNWYELLKNQKFYLSKRGLYNIVNCENARDLIRCKDELIMELKNRIDDKNTIICELKNYIATLEKQVSKRR